MQGMFYLPGVGEYIQVLDRGGANIQMNNWVLIAGGYVFTGQYRHALLTVTTP